MLGTFLHAGMKYSVELTCIFSVTICRVSGSLILSSQVGTEVGFSDALLRRPVTIQFPVIVEVGVLHDLGTVCVCLHV